MTKQIEVYKCGLCGNIVTVLHGASGTLTCCDQSMQLLDEKTADAATEKHVPVIEKVDGGYKIKVGGVAHPMEDDHYIEWVELLAGGKAYREFLKPGAAPEAVFCVDATAVSAREYCNKHGLWKA